MSHLCYVNRMPETAPSRYLKSVGFLSSDVFRNTKAPPDASLEIRVNPSRCVPGIHVVPCGHRRRCSRVAVRIQILQDFSTIHERLVGVGDKVGIRRCLDVGGLWKKRNRRVMIRKRFRIKRNKKRNDIGSSYLAILVHVILRMY